VPNHIATAALRGHSFVCTCGCCDGNEVYRVLFATDGSELCEVTTPADCNACPEVMLWMPDAWVQRLNAVLYPGVCLDCGDRLGYAAHCCYDA